jgi:hypothetical protein
LLISLWVTTSFNLASNPVSGWLITDEYWSVERQDRLHLSSTSLPFFKGILSPMISLDKLIIDIGLHKQVWILPVNLYQRSNYQVLRLENPMEHDVCPIMGTRACLPLILTPPSRVFLHKYH